MKALFNDDCDGCKIHRPRCATVYRRDADGKFTVQVTYCESCRKLWRGQYRVSDTHKSTKVVQS